MKIHLIANAHGLPMKAEISGGEVSNHKGFDQLRYDPLKASKLFIAGKGYDFSDDRNINAANGGAPIIPARKSEEFQSLSIATRASRETTSSYSSTRKKLAPPHCLIQQKRNQLLQLRSDRSSASLRQEFDNMPRHGCFPRLDTAVFPELNLGLAIPHPSGGEWRFKRPVWLIMKAKVTAGLPKVLKFTQKLSVCVRQITSFRTAIKTKK